MERPVSRRSGPESSELLTLHSLVNSKWFHTLSAPSSAIAVQRAFHLLPTYPFPALLLKKTQLLDPWIQRNVVSVLCACTHLISERDVLTRVEVSDTYAKKILDITLRRKERYTVKQEAMLGTRKSEDENGSPLGTKAEEEVAKKIRNASTEASTLSEKEEELAKDLAGWAESAGSVAREGPPPSALEALRQTAKPDLLLKRVFSHGLTNEATGALSNCIVEHCEQRVLIAVIKRLSHRIRRIERAAPRVLVNSILFACKKGDEAVLESLFGAGLDIGDVAGEVLSTVVRERASENSVDAIIMDHAKLRWGKGGVKVMQELIQKAPTNINEKGFSTLLEGLDRNIEGMEKSLHFAKLLWTIVQKYPALSRKNAQRLRRILCCSDIFLAKRAVDLLKGPNE